MYAEARPIYELPGGDPAVCQNYLKSTFTIYVINWTIDQYLNSSSNYSMHRNVEYLREAADDYEHG